MTLPAPRSSWTVTLSGIVSPLGRKPRQSHGGYENQNLTCVTCGRPFRGRRGRASCSSRCAETARHRATAAVRKKGQRTVYATRRAAGLCMVVSCNQLADGARCEFHREQFQATRPPRLTRGRRAAEDVPR